MVTKKKKMMMLMKLSSLFKFSPSCQQPRTLSFRTTAAAADSSDSLFTLSSESSSGSLSTASEFSGEDPIERMIRGLRSSKRLLIEPAGKSSSIMKEENDGVSAKEGTAVVSMDSDDPFWDFRKSMEEMVEAHGIKDWESLEELLSWYLKVNAKINHGFIVAAFVDLLVHLTMSAAAAAAGGSNSSSSDSNFSYSSSSLCCSSMEIEEITSLD